MDVAGTFFAILTKILLALKDKSVPFHFANNLDLYELGFFEFISVICRYRKTEIEPWTNTMGPMADEFPNCAVNINLVQSCWNFAQLSKTKK
jgi:hypothetical protein